MDQLIKYASRSAKQHHKTGGQNLPQTRIPKQVQQTIQRSKTKLNTLVTASQADMMELEAEMAMENTLERGKDAKANKNIGQMRDKKNQVYDPRGAAYKSNVNVNRKVNARNSRRQNTSLLLETPTKLDLELDEEDAMRENLQGKLSWHFASVRYKDDPVMESLEGSIRNGEVCVVVGDRDSRKDDFLRLLSGRALDMNATGAVFIEDYKLDAGIMREKTSYLSGGQLLIPELTVRESLHFVLNFIEPYDASPARKEQQITAVMKKLDIESLASNRVGEGSKGLSAEERVRLNLAQILLQNHPIIFLDEPTRGLDLLSTESIISTIISISNGRKIFVSMEQPTKEVLYMFKYALFLVRGTQFYYGPAQDAAKFFARLKHPLPEETSVYDHVLALTKIGDDKADDRLEKLLEDSKRVFLAQIQQPLQGKELNNFKERRETALKKEDFVTTNFKINYSVRFYQQFMVLMERMQKQFTRDFSRLYLRAIMMTLWAGVLWFVIRDVAKDGAGSRGHDLVISYWLAVAGVQVIMSGNLGDAQDDCRQTQSDLRSNLYNPIAFVLGHVLFKLFSMLILVTPYSFVVYYFLGMQDNVSDESLIARYSYMLALMLLLGAITESLNTIIGFMFLKNPQRAIYTCFTVHLFFLVFSGGLFRWCGTDDVLGAVSFLSPTKYVIEGLLINNWSDVSYEVSTGADGCSVTQKAWTEFHNPDEWSVINYCTDQFPWVASKGDAFWILLGYMTFFALLMLQTVKSVGFRSFSD